jgi:cytoskeleton protein RodZ
VNEPSEANDEMREENLAPLPEDAAEMELPPEEPPPLPGIFLREAREARKLSVFEVAQSLKFSPRQIEALEADDYDSLPQGATFQRGFVRGYAKLLKLDPVPLLAMLEVQVPTAPADVRAPQNMGEAATPVVAGRRSSKPMLYASGVLAMLAVALGIWHFLGGSHPDTTVAKQPLPAAPTPADTAMQPPDIRVEPAPDGTAPAGAAPATPTVTPADLHQLVFVFQDKSWVEVTDATQKVVFSGESTAGTRQAVSGKPPFQIVIGNAAKVELQYDDRQIDLKPYTRAEVARLTLE